MVNHDTGSGRAAPRPRAHPYTVTTRPGLNPVGSPG